VRPVVFVEFLLRLLEQGSVALSARPVLTDADRPAVTAMLSAAFRNHALDVAGPVVTFDPAAALAAAEFVGKACWYLVSRGELPDVVASILTLAPPADLASAHLSTDVVLRFLPAVHRRARALAPDDVLTGALAKVLREWPLTGALADVTDGPLTPPIFGGHPGLLLLYAERLASRPKPAWAVDGPARPYIELAFEERGLPVPAPIVQGVAVER
jgi:hypothetical protein